MRIIYAKKLVINMSEVLAASGYMYETFRFVLTY